MTTAKDARHDDSSGPRKRVKEDASASAANTREMLSPEAGRLDLHGAYGTMRTIADLQAGDHLCCLYETEDEHRAVLTPFLRQGLERGEKVVYIVDARTVETILRYLRDDGLDVESYLARGQLVFLSHEDAYLRSGVFDPAEMIALLRAGTEQALAEGYRALRVTGEMTWVLRGLPGSELLIRYEARLNEFFPGSRCLAICQYDRRRFEPAVLLDVLRTHPYVVTGAEVCHNPYYLPPADFLSTDRPAGELRRWIRSLTERKHAEEALTLHARIAVIFASIPDDETFNEVLKLVLDVMQSPLGAFGYIDEDGAWVVPTLTRQVWDRCQVAGKTFRFPRATWGNGSWACAIREKRTVYSNELSTGVPEGHVAVPRHISLPIMFQGDVIGLLQVANKETDYTDEDVRTLKTISEQVAPILQARLHRDRTDRARERLEAGLMQAQKMESIGRLAGGVAHDFNNLLTVINGYSLLLLGKLSPADPLRAGLKEIHKAGERAAGLTMQLLAFSRKQVLEPRVLDLNHVMSELRPMLGRLVGEDVELRVELSAEAGTVRADPHRLEQAVMNLVVNARDAMPHGGRLLIETAVVELDERYAQSHPEARAGRYVLLAVSDTGVGMDEQTRRQIFEPFFTTKGVGKGTGLGLSMVQGIVAQSGGHVEVYSEPGHGTAFKVYLPRVEEAAAVSQPEAAPALGGEETVLVVEDQAEVREYAAAVLKAYGYRVIQAESAGEALLLYERERGGIDLVLTDVVMPNVSGRELADRLEKLQPGIKVLFMSGYTDNVIVHHGVLEEGAHFIQKPFSPEQLATRVREVLGPPKRPARILVADDEAGVRSFLRTALEEGGYEVIEAADGRQALKQALAGGVDLVITDLVMPEQEGIETIQALRKEIPGIGIIAISGRFEGPYLKMAGMLGADAVLAKPVSIEVLLARVAEVLKSRR